MVSVTGQLGEGCEGNAFLLRSHEIMAGLDRRLEHHPLNQDRATVHTPDETAVLQIREVTPDGLPDHSEMLGERGDRDPFLLPDQGEDFRLTLVAEQGGLRMCG
jgi:hypothetical protein